MEYKSIYNVIEFEDDLSNTIINVQDWCKDNIGVEYVDWEIDDSIIYDILTPYTEVSSSIKLYFKRNEDKILFEMTWKKYE